MIHLSFSSVMWTVGPGFTAQYGTYLPSALSSPAGGGEGREITDHLITYWTELPKLPFSNPAQTHRGLLRLGSVTEEMNTEGMDVLGTNRNASARWSLNVRHRH